MSSRDRDSGRSSRDYHHRSNRYDRDNDRSDRRSSHSNYSRKSYDSNQYKSKDYQKDDSKSSDLNKTTNLDSNTNSNTNNTPWDGKKEAENDPTWARIYISGLPSDTTVDELQSTFGSIGIVAKEKQKRGYKDQWPYKIKIYQDENGKSKGDAVLTYEDPNAARSAPDFFNGIEIRGHVIKVELAGKPEPPVGGWTGSSSNSNSNGSYGRSGKYNSNGKFSGRSSGSRNDRYRPY